MNVVEANVPQADFSRLMARGGSRGGNVALLLAVRDPRVTVVSAASAPTDFYRADVAAHYSRQYQCQFIEGKTVEESRRADVGELTAAISDPAQCDEGLSRPRRRRRRGASLERRGNGSGEYGRRP